MSTEATTDGNRSAAELQAELLALKQQNTELLGQVAQYREAHTEWEQTQRLFRLMTENVDDLIAVINRQGKRVWNNPAYFRVLGYDPNDLSGSYSMLEIHPDDQAKVTTAFSDAMQSGKGSRIEYRMQHRSGHWLTLESQARAVMDANGQVELIVLVARDITDRKQAEEETLKSNKLEAVGLVAAGLAQEFNDIISAMATTVSAARSLVGNNAAASDKLKEAEQIAQSAIEVTRRLSYIAEKKEVQKRLMTVPPILKDLRNTLARETSVQIDVPLSDDGLHPILGDEEGLRRVFTNVIQNAIQAIPGVGTVTITGENVVIDQSAASRAAAVEPGNYIRVDVRDQGKGMSQETLARIFEPYFSTKTGEAGLGLSIALSIVKRHGGTIIAQSVFGIGTTISIYLPGAANITPIKPAEAPPAEAEAPPVPTGKARILVMDDEKVICDFISMTLQHLGYEAVVTHDGAQAIAAYARARAQKKNFDAVIMDLIVPNGVGGLDALNTLKRMHPGVKVIMSSGHADHPAIREPQKYAIDGVILKPYSVKKLQEVVESVLPPAPAH